MKRFILGITWQALGLIGAIVFICVATLEGPWDYNGTTGLLGALLGTDLLIPLILCGMLFLLGGRLCYQALKKEIDNSTKQ